MPRVAELTLMAAPRNTKYSSASTAYDTPVQLENSLARELAKIRVTQRLGNGDEV